MEMSWLGPYLQVIDIGKNIRRVCQPDAEGARNNCFGSIGLISGSTDRKASEDSPGIHNCQYTTNLNTFGIL
jgi:hypothetical protein